jgi:hypothetical protein
MVAAMSVPLDLPVRQTEAKSGQVRNTAAIEGLTAGARIIVFIFAATWLRGLRREISISEEMERHLVISNEAP